MATTAAVAALPNFLSRWKATVRVVDDTGKPVPHAEVTIGYYVPPTDESIALDKKTGRTDSNGLFTASGPNSWELVISARKEGYYQAFTSCELGLRYDPVRWNPTSTLVLKKIVQPIPMYAKRVNGQAGYWRRDPVAADPYVPVVDTPIGYDLNIGDWIAPYGKGARADLFFTTHFDKQANDDWNHKLVLTFPNPEDGIQPFTIPKVDQTSAFRSRHEAPTNGYQSTWIRMRSRRPRQIERIDHDEGLKFFFRVRTVLDEHGNVKSAHYGKIYGDFIGFTYYLNPTPNSRNVEFDPKKNLIQGHLPGERVNDP